MLVIAISMRGSPRSRPMQIVRKLIRSSVALHAEHLFDLLKLLDVGLGDLAFAAVVTVVAAVVYTR